MRTIDKIDYFCQLIVTSPFFLIPGFNYLKKLYYLVFHRVPFNVKLSYNIVIGNFDCYNNQTKVKIKGPLLIGENVRLDTCGGLEIGRKVTISRNVSIETHNHIIENQSLYYSKIEPKKLIIEDEVWVGEGAIILGSVDKIGRGSIVAAGAVVTKNVPEFTIVAGVPANVIRTRDDFKSDIIN